MQKGKQLGFGALRLLFSRVAISKQFGSSQVSCRRSYCQSWTAEQFKDLEATAIAASAIHRPKRFYKSVDVVEVANQGEQDASALAAGHAKLLYEIHLDKRKLKTQAGRVLKLDSQPLALAIAQEWDAQKDLIHKGRMLLTGLAFTTIDNPFKDTNESLTAKIMEFLPTDTLLYHTSESESGSMARLQQKKWQPVLDWANEHYGLELVASHILTKEPTIPEESSKTIEQWVAKHNFASLNALNFGADAVKSLLLTLATVDHHLDVEEAVELARLEQIHQAKTWGSVEFMHDVEHHQLCTRLSAAVLFTHFCAPNA
uniref:ATP synthase mitochondrial F1 complex assembly factor 2 n=1 Tax=Ditylenchus dipsaci TaxID=166011 RepID=A0A915CXC6_9BILA